MIILVTGVSGSGKSTIAEMLAGQLGWEYADADDFHPAANVAKMRTGVPLTDEDRRPWLDRIAAWIDERIAVGTSAVLTCSALKRAYRDRLRRPATMLVYLNGDRELIASRLAARRGHFFPTALLDSQFRELEPPSPDEDAVEVPNDGPPSQTVQEIIDKLGPKG